MCSSSNTLPQGSQAHRIALIKSLFRSKLNTFFKFKFYIDRPTSYPSDFYYYYHLQLTDLRYIARKPVFLDYEYLC